jgi:hypothetical protein
LKGEGRKAKGNRRNWKEGEWEGKMKGKGGGEGGRGKGGRIVSEGWYPLN